MGIATANTAEAAQVNKLAFRFLPGYARYLLEQRFNDFVAHQQEWVRVVNPPLLRHLESLNAEQFHQLAVDAAKELLTALANNDGDMYLHRSLERWQANAMPAAIARDQVLVEDITLLWHLRRRGIFEFLDGYTSDPALWKNVLTEFDVFVTANESAAQAMYLRVQQELYDQAQRLTGIGSYAWDISRNAFVWSEELYRIYEWEIGSAVDYNRVTQATHPDDRDTGHRYIQQLFVTREPYDYNYRIITASGNIKIVHAKGTLQFDDFGKPARMIGTLQDVTEQKKREDEVNRAADRLRTSEEQFRLLVTGVKDYAIFMLNPDGTIATWNAGAERIKQYSASEIIGKHFSTFYTDADKQRQHPQEELDIAVREGSYQEEGWRVRKDGTQFWANVLITALRDDTGRLRGFAKVTRDMTERMLASRRLEETVRELERSNKELSSFSYAASHDLQEPLRKIQTFTSRILAKDADNLSENSRDLFTRLSNAAARMQRLIDDLLVYSRVGTQTQTLSDVDLNAVLEEIRVTHKELYGEKQLTIRASRLPIVYGSAVQLEQLFENLISNSIKYAKPDVPPLITIVAEAVTLAANGTRPAGRYCKITVRDNGIGFEPEFSERIFEMFQRLHGKLEYEGSGIGLAIVKKIVQNHGGFVEAKGALNEGAEFLIYLPSWKSGLERTPV